MDMNDIDWVFDASREGTFPKGGRSWWRWVIKYWVIEFILVCLAAAAVAATYFACPRDVAPELVFAVVMGVLILVFCIFLVWMTYRRASRRSSERKADGMSLNRET